MSDLQADYISPHEGIWHRNDFKVGEQYATEGHVFTVTKVGDGSYQDLVLEVEWENRDTTLNRVWPNLQWVALNWERGEPT